MLKLRDMTIRQKLMAIIMIPIAAIMLMALTAMVVWEQIDSRHHLLTDILSHAEMLADNCKASIAFENQEDAEQVLSTVHVQDSVMLAYIYDRNGRLFARYEREDMVGKIGPIKTHKEGYVFEDGSLSVFQQIVLDDEIIGGVYLMDDMSRVHSELKGDVVVAGIILLVALAAGYLFSSNLQRMISRPILDLAEVAKDVSEKGDYSARAREGSADEVGYLTQVFNTMLGQIQQRDSALIDAKNQLETRVEERTTELTVANERIEGLNRLKEDLLSSRGLDKKLKCITDAVVEIFDADFARVWLIKPGDRCDSGCAHAEIAEGQHVCRYRDLCLHLVSSSGSYTHIDGEVHRRVPFGCYKIGRIAAGNEPKFLTNDVTHDPRVHNHKWANDRSLVAFAGYRLISATMEPVGVLALFSKHVISDEEDSLLESVASTTAQVIQIAVAEEELRETHQRLIEASHQAGMAEVAADVLHNVGNVLNSINVSATLITDKIVNSEIENLRKVVGLVNDNAEDLGRFLTEHQQGKHIPEYLTEVAKCLESEQTDIVGRLRTLSNNVQHIKDIIGVQQSYAKAAGVEVQASLARLVEDAIQINSAGLERHGTRIVREMDELADVEIDKQRVIQILVNLINNAKYALSSSNKEEKLLTIRVHRHNEDRFQIEVADNGIGITQAHLTKIFSHGFTTKKCGHGFGLHSSALAAKDMGGSLTAHSNGAGQGATFTLELPFKPVEVIK